MSNKTKLLKSTDQERLRSVALVLEATTTAHDSRTAMLTCAGNLELQLWYCVEYLAVENGLRVEDLSRQACASCVQQSSQPIHTQVLLLHIVKDVVVLFREAFSIHPSVPSSIHGWHHTGKKTLTEINYPLLHMCRFLEKACPAQGGHPQDFHISTSSSISCSSGIWGIFVISGLLPWSAACCYLTGHKQCKHQDFQRPGSR